ncbi:MAG: MFS transporter [Chloroflexi bacterium]|nr:MFS transporter [Chloroflexota bacterium]MBU1750166.1 MFS transporter [Chloroflexota bacterium]MBU1878796.1 MFS transporter [Chloroflexota bacterium]
MEQTSFKVYGYRWVMLLAFMSVVAINQLLWITFAPITSTAASYYGVSDLSIGLLSMVFMIVYIVVSIPASWAIDTYGIRVAVGIGAMLTGVFGLLRGLVAPDYTLVLLAQIGIAIGQPFILNAVTTVAVRWFPIQERATAAGLGSLAMYLGIILGLALTPYLMILSDMGSMLVIYGVVAVIAAVLFFVVARERPPTPPCPPGQEERSLVLDGLKQILRKRGFVLLMLIFFVGLGVFNAVTTWIEDIVRPRGFSITEAGVVGGLMVIGGIIGALVIPALSDHYRQRTPFLVLALVGATLGLIGITYATSYWLLLASALVLGFFLLSAGPVGFQYGAELAYPAPEGTSNGLLLLMGQISGIVFIFCMDGFKSPETGSMTVPLLVLIGLMVLSLLLSTRLREAKTLLTKDAGH